MSAEIIKFTPGPFSTLPIAALGKGAEVLGRRIRHIATTAGRLGDPLHTEQLRLEVEAGLIGALDEHTERNGGPCLCDRCDAVRAALEAVRP